MRLSKEEAQDMEKIGNEVRDLFQETVSPLWDGITKMMENHSSLIGSKRLFLQTTLISNLLKLGRDANSLADTALDAFGPDYRPQVEESLKELHRIEQKIAEMGIH